ncbi:hypothetical protein, partial [Pseudomonas syringae]|uniref:hypothetical protein n=1 Tax=Pseudomonas syringae TaxID=317 RepID=UPI001C55942F
LSSGYFKKFSKFPLQLQPLALRSTLELLISGRRILQRYNRVSNSFFSPLPIILRCDQLLSCSSAGGEFYSVTTACQTLFSHRCRSLQTRPPSSLTLHSKALQTIDLQGFFVSVCAGSGANYRHLSEGVNR